MKILYIYRTARKSLMVDYMTKRGPSTFLYGLPELRERGHRVDFFDTAYHPLNLLQYIFYPLEKLFMLLVNYPIGFKLHQALLLLSKYHFYDVVITTQDSAGLPILFLKRLGLIKTKVLYVCNNLSPVLSRKASSVTLIFFNWLLSCTNGIITYSQIEKTIVDRHLSKKSYYVSFGIDAAYFRPKRSQQKQYDVLAAGRDSNRDYETFVETVKDSELRIAIVCSRVNLKNYKPLENVDVYYDITQKKLRDLYNKSKIVVIPMKKNTPKSQGQVVLLEALAMHKPVIASDVAGLTTAFDATIIKKVVLVKPENPSLLQKAIYTLLKKGKRPHISSTERAKLSMQRYVQDLENILKNLS